jgi:hypothetical protein
MLKNKAFPKLDELTRANAPYILFNLKYAEELQYGRTMSL